MFICCFGLSTGLMGSLTHISSMEFFRSVIKDLEEAYIFLCEKKILSDNQNKNMTLCSKHVADQAEIIWKRKKTVENKNRKLKSRVQAVIMSATKVLCAFEFNAQENIEKVQSRNFYFVITASELKLQILES